MWDLQQVLFAAIAALLWLFFVTQLFNFVRLYWKATCQLCSIVQRTGIYSLALFGLWQLCGSIVFLLRWRLVVLRWAALLITQALNSPTTSTEQSATAASQWINHTQVLQESQTWLNNTLQWAWAMGQNVTSV